MRSKLYVVWVLVALAEFLALASAINLNQNDGVEPLPVKPDLLKFPLDQERHRSEPIPEAPAKTEVSLWERAVLSPFNRLASYLRHFKCNDDDREPSRTVAPPTTRAPPTTFRPSTTVASPTSTTVSSPTTAAPPTTVSPSPTCSCGIRAAAARIAGGQESTQNKWPWMAYLVMVSGRGYGGTLINENWVLTAAYLVYYFIGTDYKVVVHLGINDITLPAVHVTDAIAIIVHPQFDASYRTNDIALLKLEKPAPLSDAIQPICLPFKFSTTDFTGLNATVTGWGKISSTGENINKLMEVTMPILSGDQCSKNPFPYITKLNMDNVFCMYSQPGVGTCSQDEGGPVNWANGTNTYLIGVTFWETCELDYTVYPGIYVKVSSYLDWIKEATGVSFCNL